MNYYLQKQKIPRTHRFPVRRSRLDAALAAAGIEQLDSVNFNFRPKWVPDQLLVVATYKPEGVYEFYAMPESHGVVPFHAGTTSVTVYALPRSEAPLAEQLLQAQGLSCLCAWLAKAEHQDPVWRSNGHYFRLDLQNGALVATEVK